MASKVEIANAALIHLGADTISAITDDSEVARYVNQRYEMVVKAVLRAHPWNCATKRIAPARLTASPEYEYVYAFEKPQDCLKILSIDPDYLLYSVEGNKILCDADVIYIKYIKYITDSNEFDDLLVEAIAARLASVIAYKITNSMSKVDEMFSLYKAFIMEARHNDAQEGSPQQDLEGAWEQARIG